MRAAEQEGETRRRQDHADEGRHLLVLRVGLRDHRDRDEDDGEPRERHVDPPGVEALKATEAQRPIVHESTVRRRPGQDVCLRVDAGVIL